MINKHEITIYINKNKESIQLYNELIQFIHNTIWIIICSL